MIGRYAFSVGIGVVVTLSLLFVMHLLIVTGKQALTKPRQSVTVGLLDVRGAGAREPGVCSRQA